MIEKSIEKKKAIALRRKGKSYNDILRVVPVAKSTLSLWLREVALSHPQKQQLTEKKRAAQIRGGAARRRQRIERTETIFAEALKRVGHLSLRERFLIGLALYWGEGSKERTRPGTSIVFGNTDPDMIYVFSRFLIDCLAVDPKDIYVSLYIHENHRYRLPEVIRFWLNTLNLPNLEIKHIYFKKHLPKTKRINTNEKYYGTLRLRVQKSSHLLRMISGGIHGINVATCRVV